jgi:prepilin-type processing-associated H-X9-DG protein
MLIQYLVVNLGGEGEEPGVINQQGPWVLNPNWRCSRVGRTLQQLFADGHVFIICPNTPLPFPVDTTTAWLGPGVQSSEIRRILKAGGEWFRDGVLEWTKP